MEMSDGKGDGGREGRTAAAADSGNERESGRDRSPLRPLLSRGMFVPNGTMSQVQPVSLD